MLKTASGRALTDDLIEALAGEAERGFSAGQLRSRPIGRPSLGKGTSPRVQFRVDPAIYNVLLARAQSEQRGVSEIARLALEKYLREDAGDEADAGGTLAAREE